MPLLNWPGVSALPNDGWRNGLFCLDSVCWCRERVLQMIQGCLPRTHTSGEEPIRTAARNEVVVGRQRHQVLDHLCTHVEAWTRKENLRQCQVNWMLCECFKSTVSSWQCARALHTLFFLSRYIIMFHRNSATAVSIRNWIRVGLRGQTFHLLIGTLLLSSLTGVLSEARLFAARLKRKHSLFNGQR